MPKILKANDDNCYETNFDKKFKCNIKNYREIIVKEIEKLIIILIKILIFKQHLFSKEKKVVIN